MPTFDIVDSLEVRVICDKCEYSLESKVENQYKTTQTLRVESCNHCLAALEAEIAQLKEEKEKAVEKIKGAINFSAEYRNSPSVAPSSKSYTEIYNIAMNEALKIIRGE